VCVLGGTGGGERKFRVGKERTVCERERRRAGERGGE
jgi:hypothetical protein